MIDRSIQSNRSSFITYSARNINSGSSSVGTQLNDVNVPDGFALMVRANPNNNADVYLADSSADTNTAANRITLSPGDSVPLYITNANLVYVLGAAASQSIDYWVEQ